MCIHTWVYVHTGEGEREREREREGAHKENPMEAGKVYRCFGLTVDSPKAGTWKQDDSLPLVLLAWALGLEDGPVPSFWVSVVGLLRYSLLYHPYLKMRPK